MMHVIAISNEKGGVAKTTTTLSLGAALGELGRRVLLIDLDPQANLTLALGFEPGKVERTSGEILLDAAPMLEAKLHTNFANLELIPANLSLEHAVQLSAAAYDAPGAAGAVRV